MKTRSAVYDVAVPSLLVALALLVVSLRGRVNATSRTDADRESPANASEGGPGAGEAIVVTNAFTANTGALDQPTTSSMPGGLTGSNFALNFPQSSASRVQSGRFAQAPSHPHAFQEMQSLKEEILQLKAGQESLRKELEGIRSVLAARNALSIPSTPLVFNIDDAVVEGSDSAQLAVIEFSDYECSHCQAFFRDTYFKIREHYIDTGKIKYIVCDFPLSSIHPNAYKAAEAARCAAEQGKYWEMRTLLLASQSAVTASNLAEHAQTLGLDLVDFQQCLDRGHQSSAIARGVETARGMGVKGTPSFAFGFLQANRRQVSIDRMVRGAPSYSFFQQTIDQLLSSPGTTRSD